MSEQEPFRREIRSYVLREGRITPGQKRALEEAWPAYGLDLDQGEITPETFDQAQDVVLEIGFGMGDSLFEMAAADPTHNYLGVEVHGPGVGHLLQKAEQAGLRNLKVYKADSNHVLNECVPDNFLTKVQIFFPDPWHKKKHHKRRLIQKPFVELLGKKLKPGGILHIATDWLPYAEMIRDEVMDWPEVPAPKRPETKYERRGLRLDHVVTDLAYRCDK